MKLLHRLVRPTKIKAAHTAAFCRIRKFGRELRVALRRIELVSLSFFIAFSSLPVVLLFPTSAYAATSSYTQASYRFFNNQDATASSTASFSTHTDYSTGSEPWAVRSGDFNGDGKQDLVVTNFTGSTSVASTVSVYLNNGSGGFGSGTTFGVGAEPEGVTVADFSGDGKPDIAVANYWDDTVSVLINTTATNASTPTFATKVTYAVPSGSGPEDVIAADFNGDGKIDLAASDGVTGKMSFLLGTGTGTFGTAQNISIGSSSNPEDLAVGDMNGDGKPDVAIANTSAGNVTIMLDTTTTGSGTVSFTTANYTAFSGGQYGVALADFNGDGKLDLVTGASTGTTNNVCVMMGSGTGTFGACTLFTSTRSAWGVTAADFNGDGKPDIAAADLGAGVVSVFVNTTATNASTPTFSAKSDFTVGSQPQFLVAADLNGDGAPDIATPNYGSNTMSVLLNTSSAPINVGTALAAQNTAAALSADGQLFRMRLDVGVSTSNLAASGQSFKLQYAPMTTSCDTSFTNTPGSAYADVTDTSTVRFFDNTVASNGMPLATNANDPTDGSNTLVRQTYQEKGTTTFTDKTAITAGQDGMWDFALTTSGGSGSYCLRVIKSDGTTLSTYSTIPKISLPSPTLSQASYRFFNNQDAASTSSLNFAAHTDYTIGSTPSSTSTVGDFNGDGKLDIAVAYSSTISVLLGNGDGTFATTTIESTLSGGETFDHGVAADLNGDGKLDLVGTDTYSSVVIVLLGNGDGTFGPEATYAKSGTSGGVAIADVNNDGKSDIVTPNQSSNTVSVLLGNGDGTFGASSEFATTSSPVEVAVADFNGDSNPDLAVMGNQSPGQVSILLGNGSGSFNSHTEYGTGGGFPSGLAVADFNGDSKLDIGFAEGTTNGLIGVLPGTGTGTFGTAITSTTDANPLGSPSVADFNGDGKPDFATGYSSANTIGVSLGNGDGTFGPVTTFPSGRSPNAPASADFNGDGKPDLATSNYYDGTESVLINTSTSSSTSIDVGSPLAAQNTAATSPGDGQPFRMRLDVGVSTNPLAASGQNLKLQFAPMTTSCDTAFTNTPASAYADVTDTSTVRYYDNTVATNGIALVTNTNDPTDGSNTLVRQTYQEKGTTTFTNPTAVSAGQDGMWDFALTTSGATGGQNYCLRVVKNDGTALDTYAVIAEISIPVTDQAPDSPTSLSQTKSDTTAIPTGGWTNESSVTFTAMATDPDSSDMLQLCVEKQTLANAFTGTEDSCSAAVSYTGSPVQVTLTISGLTNGSEYHWQARIKDSSSEYSPWVAYGANAETARDFGVDTTAPTGGTVYDGGTVGVDASFNNGSLSVLSANWSGFDTNASGLARYEYSIGTLPGSTDAKGWTSAGTSTSVTANGLSLHTSNMYYFNVRAVDNAGNTSSVVSSDGQLIAPSVSFSVSPSVVTFSRLNAANSYTDTQNTTLTASTNAYGGYVIRSLLASPLRSANNKTIPDFNGGSYASPDSWQSGDTGFGYTSSDTSIQGVNKFQSAVCPGGSALVAPGCYAPFSQSTPGDIVADHTGTVSGAPVTNEQFTITYRLTTNNTQPATTYNASVVYSITPIY